MEPVTVGLRPLTVRDSEAEVLGARGVRLCGVPWKMALML
jgi:hypothetical protein